MKALCLLSVTLVAALALAAPARGAVTTERIAAALERPLSVSAPVGDSRLFIVEQAGVIKLLKDGVVLPTPFLDIDALVPAISGNSERGLLGLAFHPDYATNGLFYVNYTNLAGSTVIARYRVSADPDVADPGSACTLMTIGQPASNHNGGHVAFGPNDGFLYIGMGDGGFGGDPQNHAQRDDSLLGKMLRIDVDCVPADCSSGPCAPPSNPFVGAGNPPDEVWAKGVRNPYRWSFDRQTGDMYIGDVGQNVREEVSFQTGASTGGENYGWRIMEGTRCFDDAVSPGCDHPTLVAPIHVYDHGGTPFRCSVTGGYVYRGAIPEIQGHYFFADFCSDEIWSFRYDSQNETVNAFQERTADLDPAVGSIEEIAGFGEDGMGELYIVDRGTGSNGEIYKVILAPPVVDPGPTPPPFRVSDAQPNPFNPADGDTRFEVDVDAAGLLDITVHTSDGRRIRSLESRQVDVGPHDFNWDGRDRAGTLVASGMYFLRLELADRIVSQRVVVVR